MKRALVTGAAHRLGRAMACSLHTLGYDLILHYHRSTQACEALAKELNQQRSDSAHLVSADLSTPAGVQHLTHATLTDTNQLDVLVNNASLFQPDTQLNTQTTAALYQCNLHSPATLMTQLHPILASASGSIINLIDIYADHPLPGYRHYCASKAGLASLTRSEALAMAPAVRVNGIAPGAILWANNQTESDTYRHALLQKIPLRRLGGEQAICQTLRFLLECDYMTGQVIRVDGGRSLTI